MTYFKCDECTKSINMNISNTLDCDLSQVTVCDFLCETNNRSVFENESKAKILEYIDKQLIASPHICDQTNHVQVSYGNDGPFFSFYSSTKGYPEKPGSTEPNSKKWVVWYAVLLNPENDTFRIYDH